jgi:hypothetical protein
MPNTLRIKRRTTGAVGAPASLENAELAFNEIDNTLYYGKGTGGAGGTATTIEAIGGSGAFVTITGSQTVTGNKTFSGTLAAPTATLSDSSTTVATTAFVKGQNYLTGNQTVTISGDATGSGATAITLTLANVGSSGTYTKVTTDSKGRVTSGTTLSATDIPTLTAAKISDFDTQVRTSRLDQMAAPSAQVSLNSQKIVSLADPTGPQDAATKAYVDATKQGLDVKDSVRVTTTANITLSGTQTIDGVSLAIGDRVLVKDQTTASANGIYLVASAAWTRATDFDTSAKVTSGAFTFVESGTANADSGWVLTTDGTITLGTTGLSFTQFSGAGQIVAGAGLTKNGNTIDIGTANSARIVINADNIDLATVSGVGGNTYRSVTIDSYGRVTAGTNPTTISGYGITDAQPLDATLTALAGVTTSANQLIYATGSDTFTTSSLTSFGRSLIDDADAAAGRTTLGLGTISTQNANNVAITGGTIDNIVLDGGTF